MDTLAYPDNLRSEWAIEWLKQPAYRADGMLAFEYAMYASKSSKDARDRPFLLNSHLAQVRETHQRIKLTPTGEYTHVSGLTVKPEDVEEFLATDSRANPTGLDPFMFPTYWGKMEGLDPQWLRETFILPQAGQVDALIDLYLKGAEVRRLSGDHRGTTLDRQVGASSDDCYRQTVSDFFFLTFNQQWVGDGSSTGYDLRGGMRWLNVTVGQGDTIDLAYLRLNAQTLDGSIPETIIEGEAVDNAATFTNAANYDGRARTGASVTWTPPAWVNINWYNSSEAKTVVQEITNRASFASGNALVLFWRDAVGWGGDRKLLQARSYDGDSGRAPKLHIEFTEAAVGFAHSQVVMIG